MYTEQVQASLAYIQALTLWTGQRSVRQGGTPNIPDSLEMCPMVLMIAGAAKGVKCIKE